MRLERMDLRDRDGVREWRLEDLDSPVVLWWDSSEGRVDQFGDWAGSLGALTSHHAHLIDDARVGRARASLAAHANRRTVLWHAGQSGWWFDDSLTEVSGTSRLEAQGGELWRMDRPDSIQEFWARYASNSPEGSGNEIWQASSVLDERGEFHSRADYEGWLDEASALRRRLDELMVERDRLRARWEAERDADRGRIAQLRAQLAAVELELSELREKVRDLRERALGVERHEVALRTELRDLPEFVEVRREVRREVRPEPAPVDLSALEAIDRRMMSWRRAGQRIEQAIEQLRGELTNINLAGDARSEASFQRIRRGLFDFEASAEQILRVSHRMELQWPAGSDRRLPAEGELKATCESLYDELHRLYNSLNQRHASLVRRNITLRLRHLRRLQRDLTRHLKALMTRRERLVEQLGRQGVPADRLAVRAQQGFCRCAREDGYQGACTNLGSVNKGSASVDALAATEATCRYETVRTSNRKRRDELVEELRLAAEELRQLRRGIDAHEPRQRELEQRRRDIEQQLRALELAEAPSEFTRSLDSLRGEIEAGERRLEWLLELIGRYERGTLLRHHAALDRAATWIARLTRSRWTGLALYGDEQATDCPSLMVRSSTDQWHAWESLGWEDRRVIALGLVLAWNAQRPSRALWPTVVLRAWSDERCYAIAAELMRESAALGGPIWIVGSEETYGVWQTVLRDARRLPQWNRLAVELPPAPTPKPRPAPPIVSERRVVVHRVNNTDAEEFPGEFRDQLMAEAEVAHGVEWAVESSVEAYESDDTLTGIEDPEAWVNDWLNEQGLAPCEAAGAENTRVDWASRSLNQNEMLSTSLRRFLEAQGLPTWRDLADADLERLETQQGLVAWNDRVSHWQTVSRLLCQNVVERIFDARVLAACDIRDGRQLQNARAYDLLYRIRQLRESDEGRRLLASGSDDELSRLCSWVKTMEIARPLHEFGYHDAPNSDDQLSQAQWRREAMKQREETRSDQTRDWPNPQRDSSQRSDERQPRSRNTAPATRRSSEDSPSQRPSSNRPADDRRSENRRSDDRRAENRRGDAGNSSMNRSAENRVSEDGQRRERRRRELGSERSTLRFDRNHRDRPRESTATLESKSSNGERLKFYLELNHDVEAAPSIGPKSAAAMNALGIQSVIDFLRADADQLAAELGNRRVDGDVIRAWQRQTELVCRVPNLRGHDAQILVACGVESAEELAEFDPETLLALVEPYAESIEGQRVLRSAPAPDLAEVTDWIRWAGNTRQLRVA